MLTLRAPGQPAQTRQFGKPLLRIGRSPDNDVVISHASVSSHHCELQATAQGVLVHDLGSTNGLQLNGKKVAQRQPTGRKFNLRLGQVQVQVRLKTGAARPPILSVPVIWGAVFSALLITALVFILRFVLQVPPSQLHVLHLRGPHIQKPVVVPINDGPPPMEPVQRTWVDHRVIPLETLDDIALRYDVPKRQICQWNSRNCDAPDLRVGEFLRVKARRFALAQQKIAYEVEPGDSWRIVSLRFGVPVSKLRAYNPGVGKRLKAKNELAIWIDPLPPPRLEKIPTLPVFDTRQDALSVGAPNAGSLTNGIEFPASKNYQRRYPREMFGSSHAVKYLQQALATFRLRYEFTGTLVVADLSREGGGLFHPHKSHQAGRDVDIWLPTLKGVYKKSHLGTDRRPEPDEADWFAVWGMVESLVGTGEIEYIFLSYELHERVYNAAKLMNIPEEVLAATIQWPRGKYGGGILRHSDGHIHHIHVRFKCGPNDKECTSRADSHGE